jgi:hypothetical protein
MNFFKEQSGVLMTNVLASDRESGMVCLEHLQPIRQSYNVVRQTTLTSRDEDQMPASTTDVGL